MQNKFRAWDNENNRYFEPVCNATQGKLEELLINQNGRLAMWCMIGLCDESTFPNRFIIEWFTGLKDKNGVEIFEGDICRILYSDWPSNSNTDISLEDYLISIARVGEIQFNGYGYSIMILDRYGYLYPNHLNYGKHGFIEVIGNIHENANLLK